MSTVVNHTFLGGNKYPETRCKVFQCNYHITTFRLSMKDLFQETCSYVGMAAWKGGEGGWYRGVY